jgi:hypothetical protein
MHKIPIFLASGGRLCTSFCVQKSWDFFGYMKWITEWAFQRFSIVLLLCFFPKRLVFN